MFSFPELVILFLQKNAPKETVNEIFFGLRPFKYQPKAQKESGTKLLILYIVYKI